MAQDSTPTKANPKSSPNVASKTETVAPEAVNEATAPSTGKVEATIPQDETPMPTAPAPVKAVPARRKYDTPKFNPSTEKEIRVLMNNARIFPDDSRLTAEKDIAQLAMFTTNLIQLLNAEFIAKDTIARAVAYMRGDSQLPAHRAMIQAKKDRRIARRHTNSGAQSRSNVNQEKAEVVDDGLKQSLDDSKTKPAPDDAATGFPTIIKVATSTSNASSTAGTLGSGSGSDKENTAPERQALPNSRSPAAAQARKRAYWKQRRQGGRKSAGGKPFKNGQDGQPVAVNGATEAKEIMSIKEDATTIINNGTGATTGKGDVASQA